MKFKAVCENCITANEYAVIGLGLVIFKSSRRKASCRRCGSSTVRRLALRPAENTESGHSLPAGIPQPSTGLDGKKGLE